MNKYPLIGGSICAVVLLVLASLTNVVGFQTVQSSNQKMINNEIDQKNLLFQTIIDFANNKEIQKVVIESYMKGRGLFTPTLKTPLMTLPTLTKKQLEAVYQLGLLCKKMMIRFKSSSMNQNKWFNTQLIAKNNSIISKDKKLNEDMAELSALDCHCNDSQWLWPFPIICVILKILFYPVYFLFLFAYKFYNFSYLWGFIQFIYLYSFVLWVAIEYIACLLMCPIYYL